MRLDMYLFNLAQMRIFEILKGFWDPRLKYKINICLYKEDIVKVIQTLSLLLQNLWNK